MSPELERDVLVCALEMARNFVSRESSRADMAFQVEVVGIWRERAERLQHAIEGLDATAGQPRCAQCGGPAWLPDGSGVSAVLGPSSGPWCRKCKPQGGSL